MSVTILTGDCRVHMAAMEPESISAVVTDPPYGLEFMGKDWDTFGKDTSHGYREKPRITNRPTRDGSLSAYVGAGGRGVNHFQAGPPFQRWCTEWAIEAFRVLKPGGHLLAFGGTRTFHRMTVAIEDAGFEIRDCLSWLYGSGFPKSLDVSKAIDKARDDNPERRAVGDWLRQQREAKGFRQKDVAALWPSITGGLTGCVANWELGFNLPKWNQWLDLKQFIGFGDEMDAAVWRLNGRKGKPGDAWFEREVTGDRSVPVGYAFAGPTYGGDSSSQTIDITAPTTPAAEQWDGWGTALKPAWEPIIVARKPLIGTVAANVQTHGTGAINVDGCRIGTDAIEQHGRKTKDGTGWGDHWHNELEPGKSWQGRWPANVVLDEDAARALDEQSGERPSGIAVRRNGNAGLGLFPVKIAIGSSDSGYGDSGGPSRYFYTAKASRSERNKGLDGMVEQTVDDGRLASIDNPFLLGETERRNTHPTVKPVDLMQWLVRLVCPPNGTVLDPFMGSGTTCIAADREGFDCIGIEISPEYVEIARRRIVGDCPMFAEVTS